MPLFFFCDRCNRKYKTSHKILYHIRSVHNIEEPTLPTPKEHIPNNTKISDVEKKRKSEIARKKREDRLKEKNDLIKLSKKTIEEKKRLDQDIRKIELEKKIWISDRKKIGSLEECKICWDGIPNFAFVPCGHAITCQKCSDMVVRSNGRCPICRQRTSSTLRIYQ